MGRTKILKPLVLLGLACFLVSFVSFKKSPNRVILKAVKRIQSKRGPANQSRNATRWFAKSLSSQEVTRRTSGAAMIDETLRHITKPQVIVENDSHKSICDATNLHLFGPSNASKMAESIDHPPSFDETIRSNPKLSEGGQFFPRNCKPKFRIAITIPFRGREMQLRGLLAHMHPIWQRQGIEYTVYVVNQAGNELFNKGKLMNAGFTEASKERHYDCYVFHDVDLLLENDACLYWCPEETKVMHLPVFMDKFDYRILKYWPKCMTRRFRRGPIAYFGGITVFTMKQFLNINGFSNMFWGWGGEDDDASLRVKRKGYVILRNAVCQYKMFKHDHDKGNEENQMAFRMLNTVFERQDIEGLSNLKYEVVSKIHSQLYTNITVEVGQPSERMMALYNDSSEHDKCNGNVFLEPDVW